MELNATLRQILNRLDAIEQKMATKDDLAAFRQDVAQRLDDIYDGIQDVMGVLGEQTDNKVEKVRNDLQPRLEQLERIHPQGQHVSV